MMFLDVSKKPGDPDAVVTEKDIIKENAKLKEENAKLKEENARLRSCNAAALNKAGNICLFVKENCGDEQTARYMAEAICAINKAIASSNAPGNAAAMRECDRCKFWEELWHEFSSKLCPDVTDDYQRAWLFIRWLFAPAEGKETSNG